MRWLARFKPIAWRISSSTPTGAGDVRRVEFGELAGKGPGDVEAFDLRHLGECTATEHERPGRAMTLGRRVHLGFRHPVPSNRLASGATDQIGAVPPSSSSGLNR